MVGTSRVLTFPLIGGLILLTCLATIGLFLLYRAKSAPNSSASMWERSVTFKDVAGTIPPEITLLASMIKNPERYNRVGAQLPRGILLVGPPGSGKTLLAQALAGETDGNFLYIAASDFVEVYAGSGAKKVRNLFERAHNILHPPKNESILPELFTQPKPQQPPSAVIIFIDEIDALGIRGSETSENRQTINQMLTCMDGFQSQDNIVVVAATNHPTLIDPALIRSGRFDYIVTLALPDAGGRAAILRHHLKQKPHSDTIEIARLADLAKECSGADIRSIVNIAAHQAARENAQEITQRHLTRAIDQILNKKKQERLFNTQILAKKRRRR